jgi:hypothetical protein
MSNSNANAIGVSDATRRFHCRLETDPDNFAIP